jgi:hypothetical protein
MLSLYFLLSLLRTVFFFLFFSFFFFFFRIPVGLTFQFIAEENVKAKQQLDLAAVISEKNGSASKKTPQKSAKKEQKQAKKQLKELQQSSEEFRKLMHHKFIESLVAPGENVGTVAGQV